MVSMKVEEWQRARELLKEIYLEKDIIRCELCNSNWALSFHHLDKRSSGKAKNTFKDTRLLCINCHQNVEYNKEANNKLRLLR